MEFIILVRGAETFLGQTLGGRGLFWDEPKGGGDFFAGKMRGAETFLLEK